MQVLAALLALLLLTVPSLASEGPAPLGRSEIRVVGLAVDLDTRPDIEGLQDTMTAVRDVPTGLETFLGSPVDTALRTAPPGALVKAELRGPTFGDAVVELAAPPNQLFELPLLRVAGEHRVTRVRLEAADGTVLFERDPTRPPVRIDVIDQLLVSSVTTRPLTLEEIQERGIVIDEDNFTAMNFAVGLTFGSEQVTIDLPVLVPTSSQALASVETPRLVTLSADPAQLRRINIPNLSLSGFSLRPPPELDEEKGPTIPPIHGVIVIPGNIAFLHQFFSVLLQTTNLAPTGSGLDVESARATISLPEGEDEIGGTGDDPLRVAETASGGVRTELPLLDAGGADTILPQGTNAAEFLVEGLREGTHRVDFDLRGEMFVPALGRKVELSGIAAGVVQVRNPTFSIVLAHPRVVREGEGYPVFATVTNTSSTPANLFRIELASRSLSGARMADGETGLRTLETLLPGEAETFEFRLVARTTGEVTGTVFLAEEGINGSFVLTTGVGDRNIPLSPDSLVLPQTTEFLPDDPDFVAAAVRMLGMAYSVATAPAQALAADVARVGRAHVFDRAVKLAQSGLHVRFGESQDHAIEDVLLDWVGNDRARAESLFPDEAEREAFLRDAAAFDALRRTTGAGSHFDAVAGAVLGRLGGAEPPAAVVRRLAERFASRPAFLAVGASARGAPVALELQSAAGERLGGLDPAAPLANEIAYAARLPLRASPEMGDEVLMVASPEAATYTLAFAAASGASDLDLVAVVPGESGPLLLTFPRVSLDAGAAGRLVLPNGGDATLEVDRDADGVVETRLSPLASEAIADVPPSILGVEQWAKGARPKVTPSFEMGDPIGRMIGVLFSEEVSRDSAERLGAYTIADNAPVSVALQPDRRLAFVVFEKPVGPFVPRTLAAEGVKDLRDQPMPHGERPVAADPERGIGARVIGRVLRASGEPIPFANVRYLQPMYQYALFECFPQDFVISSFQADAAGRFSIDFALQSGYQSWEVCSPDLWLNQRGAGGTNHFKLDAEDPETGEVGRLSIRPQFDGQTLRLDVVIRGFGAIDGRVLEEDGTAVAGGEPGSEPALRVFAQSLSTGEMAESWVDGDGRYAFPRRFVAPDGRVTEAAALPAGNVALLVVRPSDGATAVSTLNLPAAGARETQDLVLLPPFRYGAVSGIVFEADGRTPAANVAVHLAGRVLSGVDFGGRSDQEGLLGSAVTDAAGTFRFEHVPAGNVRVVAQRASTFEEGEARGVVPESGEARLQLVLPGGGGTVTGLVIDAFGNPVAGAAVAGGFTMTVADANGRFEIRGLPRGSVTVYGQALDSPALGTVRVTTTGPGDLQEVVVTLQPVGSIAGTVFEADGVTPIVAQKVQLWLGDTGVAAEAFTDAQGSYAFRNYPVGKYSLRAIRRSDFDGGMADSEIRFAGDVRDVDLRFRGLGEISGRVVQSNGTPAIADLIVTRKVWRILTDASALPVDNRQLALEILAQYAQIPGLGESVARAISENGLDQPANEYFVLADESAHLRSDELGPGGEVTGRFRFAERVTGGPFSVAAFGPFLAPAVVKGEIPRTPDPSERAVDVGDIVIEPATGAVRGTVYMPDGVTPVGENVAVRLRSLDNSGSVPSAGGSVTQPVLPEIEVVTDAEGRFEFPLVLRGSFVLTADTGAPPAEIRATSPAEMQTERFEEEDGSRLLNVRLFGEARGAVPLLEFGEFMTADVRLRDVAGARVRVVAADGVTPIDGARVAVSTSSTLDSDPPAAFTDASGEVTFFPILEGPFSVSVSLLGDPRRGAASGSVPENGPNGLEIPVTVQLGAVTTASGQIVESAVFGSVAGTVFRADGTRLVNPAQVAVTSRGARLLATSDAEGRYVAENVPGGPFRVDVFEPLTSRRGSATGALVSNGQTVETPVTLVGLGTVTGSVLRSDGSASLPGVDVELAPSGDFSDRLVTRTDASGAYELPGVPLGPYTVRARDFLTGLAGEASATLIRDGDLVTTDVRLQPSGGIAGVVYGPGVVVGPNGEPRHSDGSAFPDAPRAAGVAVEIRRGRSLVQTVQTGDDGGFSSGAFLPTGNYDLVARSPISEDGAVASASIRFDGEIAFAALALAGTGSVTGVVLDSLGSSPVAGASVTFSSESRFTGASRSRITDAAGRFRFENVPVAGFSLSVRTNLQEPQLGGAASGAVRAAGDLVAFEDGDADPDHEAIRLQPAGAIEARVLLADGSTLAEGAVALLEQQPAGLRLSRVANATGQILFEGIPLGSYRLSVREPVTNGVASRRLALTVNGEVAGLGDLVLDAEGPNVVSTEPAESASGVSPSGEIVVRFDEPVDAASVTAETFVVRAGGAAVPGARTLRDGGTALAFVPAAPLSDLQRIDVTVRADRFGFENELLEAGVRDLAGLSLAGDFAFGFTTGDTQPPRLVSVSPAGGASEVHVGSVVRFEFSEPVARESVAGVSLTRSGGAAVAGGLGEAPILGGRVLVFTPDAPLAVNETYTARLQGPVRDLASNPMPEAELTTTFSTVDTRPPELASLALAAGSVPVTGRTVVLEAALAGDEPGARVEFSVGGALLGVATSSPFTQTLLLSPALGTAASVRAVAVDAVGNRSPPRDLSLAIAPNEPPHVTLVRPASGPVSQGDTITVEVLASDDVGLAELRFVASDGAVASGSIAAVGESAVRLFTFQVPGSAPVGSLIPVRAAATDALGVAGQSATALLEVGDRLPPAVTIGSPAAGATVSPGSALTVLVRGDDASGVSSLRLSVDALGFDETRSFSPPVPAAQGSFTVPVAADAPAGSLNLVARALDAAGNESTRIGVVRVRDVRAPSVRLATGSGSLLAEPGAAVAIDVAADDDVGVVRIDLAPAGQSVQTRSIAPAREARERFTLVVPESLALGATLDVGATAFDADGNAAAAAPLTLTAADLSPPLATIAEPAEGGLVRPGETFDVHVVGSDRTGVAVLALTVTGAATATETRPFDPPAAEIDETLAVAVPAGAPAGAPVSLAVVVTDAGGRQTALTRTLRVADVVRPAVVAVDPPSGATGVAPQSVVRVTFDEPVARGSVTAETLSLACGEGAVAASLSFASADTLVVLTPAAPLREGDLCTVSITTGIRDAAGNALAAPVVASFSVRRPDTTPPAVVSIDPAGGAAEVPLGTVLRIRFSEAIAPASVTPESVVLEAAGGDVVATRVIEDGGAVVAVTPSAPLAPRTAHVVRIGTGITDLAGNALEAPVSSAFTTEGPDLVGPRLVELLPADGAGGVSVRPVVRACFDDVLDPASFGAGASAALRVLDYAVGGAALSGSLAASGDGRCVALTLDAPLGFEHSYAAELRGTLRGADGNPVSGETGQTFETLTHAFVTGRFAITQPAAGAPVIEQRAFTIEASGSAALGIARVAFTVNGEALPAVTAAPFRATLTAPRAAETPALTITATAFDAANAELATDAVMVPVVVGLGFERPISGVPLGETGALRLVASSPPLADVAIALRVHDASIVGLPASVVFPAGARSLAIPAAGLAEGATAVVATSSHGSASTIASVSERTEIVPGTAVIAAPTGAMVRTFPSAGEVILPPGAIRTLRLRLLDAPAASVIPVEVTSSDPSVATIGASVVLAAGETSALVTLVAGASGETRLTLRFGGEGRELRVVVGAPAAGAVAPILAPQVGALVLSLPSLGDVIVAPGGTRSVALRVFDAPVAQAMPLVVTSSNPAVAAVTQAVAVPAGSVTATLPIDAGLAGEAILVIRPAGDLRAGRELRVVVGTPEAGETPPILAPPIGALVLSLPSLGDVIVAPGGTQSLSLRLFDAPVAQPTPLVVSSSNPAVAAVTQAVVVPAGSVTATLPIDAGLAGEAILVIRPEGDLRAGQELRVVVGTPEAGKTPPILAAPVGAAVLEPGTLGAVYIDPGSSRSFTLDLLAFPSLIDLPVSVESRSPAVASVTPQLQTLPVGQRRISLSVTAFGSHGDETIVDVAYGAERRTLLVIVGVPAAGRRPEALAPPVGIEVPAP